MKQELTAQQRAVVQQAYARLPVWRDGCREMHERAKEARRILLLQDPKQDAGRRGKKRTLQLQTLKSTYNSCVADQMDNMPEAVLLPETRALQAVAEDMNDAVRHVLSRNRYESLHRMRVEDCFLTGTAVTQVVWDGDMDDGRGNVAVLRWPVEAFLWDPAADTIDAARALFKVSWHPLSWFEERYPQTAHLIGSDMGEYSGLGMPDAQSDHRPADEDRALLVEYWWRTYDHRTRRHSVHMARLAGGVLLSLHMDVYRHGMYPFVLDVYTPIEGMPVGDGLVQEMAPMMRYVNRYASYIDENLRMASKGRLLVDRNAGIDKDALMDWENDVVEGDRIDAGALKWMQSAPLSTLASAQMLQLQSDIKQDSGQNQFSRGEPVGGVTAASAISALQEAGGKVTRLRTAVLNQGFVRIVTQIMWLMNQFYDERRVVYITGRDGQREVSASPMHLFGRAGDALPPPPYTVQVQVQRRNPLRQQAQNELFMQAYQMAAQAGQYFPLSALFELLQVDGKDRILPVLKGLELMPVEVRDLTHQRDEMAAQRDAAAAQADVMQQKAQELEQKLLEMAGEREEMIDRLSAMQQELERARYLTRAAAQQTDEQQEE